MQIKCNKVYFLALLMRITEKIKQRLYPVNNKCRDEKHIFKVNRDLKI